MVESRKSGPGSKVRSGCITCKARRVKCDETKPSCLRCQTLRLECGGYARKQKPTPSSHRLLPLVPKIQSVSKTAVPLAPTPSHELFANDQEFNYFKVYAGTTAPQLGEYFDTPIWSTIVLQASEQEYFIKHAIIALGALNQSHDVTTSIQGVSGRVLRSSSPHYQVAFHHYGSSIQGIRKACEEQRKSRRTILIACLLAVCFEYYHGNIDLATAHVKNGIKLIDEWFLSMKHLVSVIGQQFLQGIIEDELISIFTRLERDIYIWHEVYLVEMHPELQKNAARIILAIPARGFADLHMARRFFDIMLSQVDRFVYNIEEMLWDYSRPTSRSRRALQLDSSTGAIVLSKQQRQRFDFLKDGLASWRKAFQPALAQSLKVTGRDLLVAKTLALNFLCSAIALRCCLGPELTYDAEISDFQAALSMAGTLFDMVASKKGHTFIVTSIIIKSLFFIASKCRDKSIRTKARDYLQAMSRQEGIWDSTAISAMTNVVMKLEETGESGLIPEHKRLRAIRTSFDLYTRQGTLRFLTIPMKTEAIEVVARCMEFRW
ncbi:hypothetical protein L207DRAFT_585525 [Hyaloscypha variabilis F]|uniref:Zn(2)-C6 fungal-type domain-containing protein n=1 Tax=Hyaloscypha variabilis (strain UAMH 11265 / GT02V1 / F) TaxID=1149755 RepID=A0A2J6RF81_HYAVF|nr:hypothetical protein L207DRAFT_585525 [Hyaloscypha variabilis F]